MNHLITGLVAASLFSPSTHIADHRVGGGDDFPAEVQIGDTIRFDRPAMGGRYAVEVTVNGKPATGRLIMERMAGKALIGGGRLRYEVHAEEAGLLTIQITITPAGECGETKTHTIKVKG
ncbi:hypothetical protein [Zavarzinella formosa]|uniref:hypothetical protein n=1 Tax=Zavarzinella formosa TaxID=360055 RepID=UPI0002E8F19B|nr:hypothetical protein [Zavarzinella formosa]